MLVVKSRVEILRSCGINILVVFSDIPEFCFDYKLPTTKNIAPATLCVTGAMLYQLSYQSHMRVVVSEFGPLCSVDAMLYQLSYQSHTRAVMPGFGPLCSVDAKVVGSKPVKSLFSGHFPSSVIAAFTSFILSILIVSITNFGIKIVFRELLLSKSVCHNF